MNRTADPSRHRSASFRLMPHLAMRPRRAYSPVVLRIAQLWLLLVIAWLNIGNLQASELLIAAASDLSFCIEELNGVYSTLHPETKLKVSIGSSGNFFAQIKNGAPYDLFFSADMNFPRELVKSGLAEERSLTRYAVGKIVLWTVHTNLDIARGLELVKSPAVKRVAIANPEHAPYGQAARSALQHYDLWAAAQPKLVIGENISQTAQFVQTGSADIGIVALALVLSPQLKSQGRYFEIPPESYPPLEQGAVLTKKGAADPAAQMYIQFIVSPQARTIFDRFGFRLPNQGK